MTVQHNMPPSVNITRDTGNPIISQRQAVKIAPVSLNPIHNKNTVNKTVKNKLIIRFTPFTFFPKLLFYKISVPLGLITVYNESIR